MKKIIFTLISLGLLTMMFASVATIEGINNSSTMDLRQEYFVDFEGPGETKTSYAAGNVNLSGKDWHLDNVLIGTDNNDMKFDSRSARFRHQEALAATMTMLEDKANGLGTISFYYARSNFSNDRQPTAPIFVVEYSLNQGSTWTQIGNDINLDGIDQLTLFSQTVNVEGNVRVRFRSISGTDGRRFNIDNILLTDFGDEEAVAPPAFSPPGGSYFGSIMVSITTVTPDATIHYTMDGTDPTDQSPIFTDPIEVTDDVTIKARGYATGLNPSIISTANYTIEVPIDVDNIAELKASPQGEIYRLTEEVILTYQQTFRNQKYIQDDTGGILIDDNTGIITTQYQVYDGITGLVGTLGEYGNMIQFVPAQNGPPASSHDNVVHPIVITMNDYLNDFMTYQSWLVKIENVYFPDADGSATFANGQVYTLSDGTNTIDFRTTFYDVDYIGDVIPTDTIDLTGIPNSRTEGHFITSRDTNDLYSVTSIDLPFTQPLELKGNYPNPFNPSTLIHFTLPEEAEINLTIYNIRGQKIRELYNGYLPAGEHRVEWNGRDDSNRIQSSGVYFYQLQSGDQTLIRKALMIK
ncbi:MAG: chitobiase/beta-hexosaminidase C-terminal domain-containing protein [Candidatus Cloacimonetes bacterium]|nr:chitobiase/beta-hexosaminidase C-terminal domain-containing protein [Candidatus Cloacimonadota bacterium]